MNAAVRVPVLMYHGLGEAHDAWSARFTIGPRRFAEHMAALAAAGFSAVSIDAMLDALDGRAGLPAGAFVLTFDDGYLSVAEHALPVLERLRWPHTVFLVSERIGGDNAWDGAGSAPARPLPLLGSEEIRAMQRRGTSFQSHSATHKRLPELGDSQLHSELRGSREALEALLDEAVPYLAYPFGAEDQRVREAARAAGYRAAFSTRSGFNGPGVDRWSLRRLEVYGTDSAAMLLRKIRLGSNDGSMGAVARYLAGRVAARFQAGSRRPNHPGR